MQSFFRRPFLVGILIVGIVLILGVWARVGAPEIRVLFSPLVRLAGAPGRWLAAGARRESLEEEVERLRALAANLSTREGELTTLRDERDALAALLGYEKRTNTALIPARVSARARDPFTQAFFIDRGRNHGVTERAPVVMKDGLFIGIVERVWDRSALVLVATDRKSKVPAQVLGRDSSLGVLEGHGVLYHLTLVPSDVEIQNNDTVVTGSLGEHIPPGLVIGTVSGIATSGDNPFKTILVTPIEPLANLTIVAVFPQLQTEGL